MNTSTDPITVAEIYFAALAAGDFATVVGLFAEDLVWHQPGGNRFSGTHRGATAVTELIGGMMTVSQGTFKLAVTAPPMANGDLVAVPVRFTGERDGAVMAQDGLDLLRIRDGKVAEAWLFSGDPASEDAFWGIA